MPFRGATTTSSATLAVTPHGALDASLDLVERTSGGAPVRAYDVEMTKQLHLILISDDFATFAHLHPSLGAGGHFTLDVHVPHAGRYYVYADGEPHGQGKSVFRFAVRFGNGPDRSPLPGPAGRTAMTGPYAVTLDSLALSSAGSTSIGVHVSKNGSAASDITPYLGGAAHAVFIDDATLAYVHVHPSPGKGGDMPAMTNMGGMAEMPDLPEGSHVPADMRLAVGAIPAGRYRLWLQFRAGNALHVASFALTSR